MKAPYTQASPSIATEILTKGSCHPHALKKLYQVPLGKNILWEEMLMRKNFMPIYKF